MSDSPKTFGPMHGERTPRHQFVAESEHRRTIVSIVDGSKANAAPRLWVEFMGGKKPNSQYPAIVSADLSLDDVKVLRDACDEFIRAYDPPEGA